MKKDKFINPYAPFVSVKFFESSDGLKKEIEIGMYKGMEEMFVESENYEMAAKMRDAVNELKIKHNEE